MDPGTGTGLIRAATAVAKAAARPLKLERARREAERAGLLDPNLLRPLLEEALGVLAQDSTTLKGAAKDRLKAFASERPSEFDRDTPLAWIRTEKAQERLIELATDLVGGRPAELLEEDVSFYESFGPDQADFSAGDIIDLALQFMLASAYRHLDPTARVVLSRLEPRMAEMGGRLNEFAQASAIASSAIAVEAQDSAISAEVHRIRHSLAMSDSLRAQQSLLADRILKGDLAGATPTRRAFGLSWAVRLSSGYAPDGEVDRLLEAARRLDRSEYVRAAEAMRAGRDDWEKGLEALRPFDTAVLRGAAARLRYRAGSAIALLEWLEATEWKDEDLDSGGKLVLARARLREERWQEASSAARTLASSDFDEEPELLHLAAVGLAAMSLPSDMRRVLLAGLPVGAEDIRLADDPDSIADRREAAALFERAAASAAQREGHEAARSWAAMALWLRLRDAEAAAAARASLVKGLADRDEALSLVPLAIDFGIAVDRSAVERAILAQLAVEPGGSVETARARLALALSESTPQERAAALAKHQDELGRHIEHAALVYLRGVALAEARDVEQARALVEEAARDGVSSEPLEHLREALASGQVLEPPPQPDLDPSTATTPALATEVERLGNAGVSDRYVQLARALIARTRSTNDAERLVNRLLDEGRHDDIAAVLSGEAADLVAGSAPLLSARAWSAYWRGDFSAAEADLELASATRDHPADRALRVNLLIASGRWPDLAGFVEEEWTKASDRSAAESVGLAKLAAAIGSGRRDALTDMAAAAAPEDPQVLMECYLLAIRSGRDEEPQVGAWLNEAVRLSGEHGPVKAVPVAEMIGDIPERRKRLEAIVDQLRRGDLPLFLASQANRRPLVETHLATLLENRSQPDGRRKTLLPVISGARISQPPAPARSVTLDAGAVFDLGYLGLLDVVLDAFEEVLLPHSLLFWLFEEKQRLPFHQPSRAAQAHRLRRWIAEGAVTIADDGGATPERIDAMGKTLAGLVAAAEKAKVGGAARAFVIHGFPVQKPGSLSGEAVELGEIGSLFAGSLAAAGAASGLLQRRQVDRARAHLTLVEQPWPQEVTLNTDDVIFLDGLALDHLRAAGALEAVVRAFADVRLSSDAVAEADALIAHQTMADEVIEQVDRIRATLSKGIASGKVRLAPAVSSESEAGSHPSSAALLLAGKVDAIVSDDRFVNVHPMMNGPDGDAPIWTSLDMLQALRERKLLDEERHYEALAALRSGGVCFVPLDPGELEILLGSARTTPEGELVETAELKAVRESLRLVQARGVLRLPQEANWMRGLTDSLLALIPQQWSGKISDEDARARSDWLLSLADMRGWAASVEGPTVGTLSAFGMAGTLSRLLISTENGRPAGYDRWLEDQIDKLSVDYPAEYALLLSHLRSFVHGVAAEGLSGIEDPEQARQLGAQLGLNMLPPFMQLKVSSVLDIHEAYALEVEGRVQIGDGLASFPRSTLHQIVRQALADRGSEHVILDESGAKWRATQPDPSSSRVRLTGDDGAFTENDFFPIDPDPERRLAGLHRAIREAGMGDEAAEAWRSRLKAAPLAGDLIKYLEEDLAANPRRVAHALERQALRSNVPLTMLVPTDRRYYERLAGAGEATALQDYAERIALPLMREVLRSGDEGIARATLLNGHPLFADGLRDAEDPQRIARWTVDHGDPFACVLLLEAYLPCSSSDPTLAEALLAVARKLHGTITTGTDSLEMLSALAVLADGEVSRSGILADWPPFRRRAATLAHAALAFRAAGSRLPQNDFPRWALETRGYHFLAQSLLDLRKEPRWDAELIDGAQLRQEIIGRLLGAAAAACLPPGDLHDLLLGEAEDSFMSLAGLGYCWPGPLEGGTAAVAMPIPEEAERALEAGLSDERASLAGLTPLLNTRRMGSTTPERVNALVALLERSNYLVEGADQDLMLRGILPSFAGIAASTRSAELAAATRIVARRARLSSPGATELALELRAAVTAAAAFEHQKEWACFAGKWAEELASEAGEREAADTLMRELEEMYALDSSLRIGCGRATALLRMDAGR